MSKIYIPNKGGRVVGGRVVEVLSIDSTSNTCYYLDIASRDHNLWQYYSKLSSFNQDFHKIDSRDLALYTHYPYKAERFFELLDEIS